MSVATIVDVSTLTAMAAVSWGIISYAGYARTRGLTSGAQFASGFSLLQLFAWVGLSGSVLLGGIYGEWWYILVTLIGATILARLLFTVFGQFVQVVLVISILPVLTIAAWRALLTG